MYYVHSSPSEPKDREGLIKEKGVGSGGKDLKAESPKETGREAWRHHVHQAPSPIREGERQRAMQRDPLEYPGYAPKLEVPNVREIKRAEGPGGAKRSGEDTQEVQVPQPPWTENPAGRRTRG